MNRLRTLGALELVGDRGNRATSIHAQPRRLALLVYLAVESRRGPCRRDTLLSVFWPEVDDGRGRQSLRQAVYMLRRALGPDVLADSGGDDLEIRGSALWCDAVVFEEEAAADNLETALDLYGGDFLTGFHVDDAPQFEDWVHSTRTHLREAAADLARSLSQREEGTGNLVGAIRWARQAAVHAPYDERTAIRLLELLGRSGDRSGAVWEYERFAQRLANHLDLEPSSQMRSLISGIRAAAGSAPDGEARVDGETGAPLSEENVRLPEARSVQATHPPAESVTGTTMRGHRPRWSRAVRLSGLIVAVVGLAYWFGVADRGHGAAGRLAEVPSGADRPSVAVLPFMVRGPEMELWAEGLAVLLSINLDGSTLRAIDSRTVLARWSEQVGEGKHADLETALGVARATGARHVVVGTAVATGSNVRLAATVRDLQTGELLDRVQADGPADSIIALVDRLSIATLRSLIRGSDVEPRVDLAAVTTGSIEALKAFLEGEQRYRTGNFTEAEEAYQGAIAADPDFALAHFRLGLTRGWTDAAGTERALEPRRRAVELADGLPPRERGLAAVALALALGDENTIDSARVLADLYPDDSEAWYLLGEVYYHLGAGRLISQEETEEALLRAVALDSAWAPHFMHLVDLAFTLHADSALAANRIAHYRELAPDSHWNQYYAWSFEVAFGDSASRTALLSRLETRDAEVVRDRLGHPRFWPAMERVQRLIARGEDRSATATALNDLFYGHIFQRGQLEEALEVAADPKAPSSLAACGLLTAEAALRAIPPAILDAYLAPAVIERRAERVRREPTLDRTTPLDILACGTVYARYRAEEEEHRRLRARLGELTSQLSAEVADPALDPTIDRVLQLVDAMGEWLAGDPGRALRALRDFPSQDQQLSESTWLGQMLLELGRPEEAVPHFAARRGDPVSALWLGRAYEALERHADAREAYAYFLTWWSDADPELQPLVENARHALERVAARLD